jgi:hypothetical protein
MRKVFTVAIVLATVLIAAAAGQNQLVVTKTDATIDGLVSREEYSLVIELPRAVLYLNRTEQNLSIALHSQLDGWIAVGLGSQKMNKAMIYIGYVDGGREVFAGQLGRGHGHRDAEVVEPGEYRLREDQSGTVLELKFPVSAMLPAEATSFSMIVACGKRDNLNSYHSLRRGLEILL